MMISNNAQISIQTTYQNKKDMNMEYPSYISL